MTMNGNNVPTYAFAEDPPPARAVRTHRRGRPGLRLRKGNAVAGGGRQQQGSAGSGSYRQGGRCSSAATSAQSPSHQHQPQSTYHTTDAWGGSGGCGGGSANNDQDANSAAGSLSYSASSSVQSAESSNDSSFADIIKLIDSEGEAASELNAFMSKQSKAASDPGAGGSGNYNKFGQDKGHHSLSANNAAVQGYWQRNQQQQREAKQMMQQAQHEKKRQQQHAMAGRGHTPGKHVDFNYSKDIDEDVIGLMDFDDQRVLDTIGGHDDDKARHAVTVTTQKKQVMKAQTVQAIQNDPFRGKAHQYYPSHQDALLPATSSPTSSPYSSSPSSPRSLGSGGGHVTPPPSSRSRRRTSTPPNSASHPISRTNSRHSKSSSDGSWDTPAPSSPPHAASASRAGGTAGSTTKPPHARNAPAVGGRRKKGGKEERAIEDLSEAFYTKSWMCGFADAFNFDGFDKLQK